MYLIISYDISNDKRRSKVHDILQNYGYRVQYSVFECDLKPRQYEELRETLSPYINTDEDDSLRYYLLCEQCVRKIERVGGITPRPDGPIIL